MMIGREVQGCYYEQPQRMGGPYIPHSPYMNGWLAAGGQCPDGDFLMVGLGSGAGAVGLLLNFPDITLTVLELSPEVLKGAEELCPLVGALQGMGRLTVHLGDAKAFLDRTPDTWDVGLGDAYQSKPGYACETTYLPGLLKHSREYWLNVIGRPQQGTLPAILGQLRGLDRPPGTLLTTGDGHEMANWLVGETSYEPHELELGCRPFEGQDSQAAREVRAQYRHLVARNYLARH